MISDNYVTGDNIYLRELQNFFFEVLGMMSITHYGAVGDGRVDNYGPLQVAIDDAHRRGLNFLYVPYGRFIYTGELINVGDLIFMGNPHAHIVNIRTGEEIEIHQFGWLSDNYYSKIEADGRFVKIAGDTMTGSLAIGSGSTATGSLSFAQGNACTASGNYSHAEGRNNTVSGIAGHVEGGFNTCEGYGTHAEGVANSATGNQAHAEGYQTQAPGPVAHAEGHLTEASGTHSHAEGNSSTASGNISHAEGYNSTASGAMSHVEGYGNTASGYVSHAGGKASVASGWGGFAHGLEVKATRHTQTVFGIGNIEETGGTDNRESTTGLLILGNGSVDTSSGVWVVDTPSNAFKCTYAGDVYIAGSLTPNGADYAESVEWLDGNPNEEDRVGKFVVLEGNKMRLANSQDNKEIMGVVSAKPTVLGDAFDSYWHGKYVTDVYGRIQYETRTLQEEVDEEGNVIHPASTQEVPIVSPDYNPTLEYVSRVQRKEYGCFAMLGKLIVEDDGTCEVGGYCFPNDNGIATANTNGYYVMERIDETHIRIFVR